MITEEGDRGCDAAEVDARLLRGTITAQANGLIEF